MMLPFAPRHGLHFNPALGGARAFNAPGAIEQFDPDAPESDEFPAAFWLGVVTRRRFRANRTASLTSCGMPQTDFDPRRGPVFIYELRILADKAG